MIRDDFLNGGFPICNRNPVLCITPTGDIYVTYDRYGLKMAIESGKILKCVGVWPGNKNTDIFPLNQEYYKIAPPVEHRAIDNAVSVSVYYKDKDFDHVGYMIEEVEMISKDAALLEYIEKAGIKHTSMYM